MYLSALIQFTASTDCYIDLFDGIKLHSLKHPPNMLALCWHSTKAYYVFHYAGIFDTGLLLVPYTSIETSITKHLLS